MCVCVFVCACVRACVCVHVYICIYMCIGIYVCIYIYIYVYIYNVYVYISDASKLLGKSQSHAEKASLGHLRAQV